MSATTTLQPLDVIQGQLDAYNRQDLDAHCAFFADDVVVADLNGAVTIQGAQAYRAKYTQVFADFPRNRAELVNRIQVGNTVIDHERVFRQGEGESFEVIAIYTLAGGRIARVDFAK
ncbi:nuclear transport factor 2 family protein [Phenylobacterium sp. SCN 70-31]|uniref:nuclear transport factor 2 family protein n=1 Tax=Phenylobacterium sp. SCN 70-31 TaxID=1660129 RepID=UPI00086B8F6E|nr:nuclear transport factor 2 family protein [Phenylobacterium sp. SCN 70-31]ODT87975.1 MAG: NTF2 enzyme family protein [Phenylobacterium sp. SCN 70-31]